MRKRIISFVIAVITAVSVPVFAYAAGNTLSITDAESYIKDNLKDGYLYFDAGRMTYEIDGKTLRDFYYNSDVKYYVFKADGITVRADKNGFFDFDLKKASFCASLSGFDVKYYYNSGAEKALDRANVPVYYEISWPDSNSRTTASFNGQTVAAQKNEDGVLRFETTLVGGFTVVNFEFEDVKEPFRWYYNHVNSAGALGILDGMDGKNFEPRSNVTRAQLAAMIVKATQDIVSYRIDTSISFSDVPAGKWYYEYIMKCAALGIVDGVGEGKYNPLAGATREEIATVIARLLKVIGEYGNQPLPSVNASQAASELARIYSDSGSIHSYARESVLLCYKLGIMQGDSEGFRARSKIVRAECAKIFYLINRELSYIK